MNTDELMELDNVLEVARVCPEGSVRISSSILLSLVESREQAMEDSNFLDALQAAGVDNWCGYGDAKDIMEEWNE